MALAAMQAATADKRIFMTGSRIGGRRSSGCTARTAAAE
jgi:hypothetical protein